MSERQAGQRIDEISADLDNLHREDVFSDMRLATIRRLQPIRHDGSPDPSRPTTYIAETTIVSQLGPIPVQSPIEADSLKDAFSKFPEAIRTAVDRLSERAQEMRREEASRIVVPGSMPPDLGGGRPGGGASSSIASVLAHEGPIYRSTLLLGQSGMMGLGVSIFLRRSFH